ncbi:MAG: hypothetical protein CMJ31_12050 [Phycisphaerae bacterium]|nr:hypothetical protein [Phycisphaerae bacterium]|tara:strand:+ start:93 stop:533 length:441 start_codon:yes stop_codon:yes gene_type:complete
MERDELLANFLRDHDAVCPVCRYNVRGLTDPVCPECGVPLSLTVGTSEPRLGLWLTTLVVVASAGGFLMIAGGALVVSAVMYNDWPPFDEAWSLYMGALLSPLVLWGWLRYRPRIRASTAAARRWLSLAAMAFVVLPLLAFFWLIV